MARHRASKGGIHQLRGHALARLLPRQGLQTASRQSPHGARVELPEHLRLPARHDAGTHGAHVGEGQEVEHAQALRGAAHLRQSLHGLRIVDVPPLRDVREGHVLGHEENHGARGLAGQPQSRRQLLGERDALGDMPVPLALADIVQEHAQHQEVGMLDLVEHLRETLGLRGGPGSQRLQTFHGDERVLVGRELVIDVVLHQTGEGAELRQVAPEKAQVVHGPEGLGHPPPAPADVEEEIAHLGRSAEAVVDEIQRLLDRPLGAHAKVASQPVGVPVNLHEPRRVLAQVAAVGMHEMDALVHDVEPVGERFLSQAPLDGTATRERLLAAQDQLARHPVDDARVEIVVAHELLDGEGIVVADVAEVRGDLRLDVAREHVVLVAGEEVELVPYPPEEGEGLVRLPLLALGDHALLEKVAEGARAELGRGEPHGRVEVAQPARGLLDVGLAHVRRAPELAIALVALGERRLQELAEVLAVDVGREHLAEALEEPPVPHEVPRLLHGGSRGEIRRGHGHAVGQAAHGMSDGEAQVPQGVEEALGGALDERLHDTVVDEHEVEIGERAQLAAPVAAEGNQDERSRRDAFPLGVVHGQSEEGREEAIHEGGVGLHRLLARRAPEVGCLEEVDIGGQVLAEELEPEPPLPFRALGGRPVEAPLRLCLHAFHLAEKVCGHDETVHAGIRDVKSGADLDGGIE